MSWTRLRNASSGGRAAMTSSVLATCSAMASGIPDPSFWKAPMRSGSWAVA